MTAFGMDMNLIKDLTESKDSRLEFLWTAVSLAQQAGNVRKKVLYPHCTRHSTPLIQLN